MDDEKSERIVQNIPIYIYIYLNKNVFNIISLIYKLFFQMSLPDYPLYNKNLNT